MSESIHTDTKRILIIATVGGFLQKFEMDNVLYLKEQGYEVHYAANLENRVYEYDRRKLEEIVILHPMDIRKSPFQIAAHLRVLKELTGLIRTCGIGLIHCHTPVGGVLGRLAAQRCKSEDVQVIYTAHGFQFYRGGPLKDHILYKTVERFLAHYTDVLIVINQEDFETASAFRLKAGGQVVQIPGVGLDRQKFCPLPDEKREALRASLGIEPDQICFMTIGELNENKHHKIVLDMLCRMRERGDDLSALRYLIYGRGHDMRKLSEKIKRLGLTHVVVLCGYCTEPEKTVPAADLFFFPSRREGLGMAALEALSCGTPVIAADNRGTREYLQPGKNGYLCSWNQPEEFLWAFDQWSSLDQEQRQQMRAYCSASVERFDRQYTREIMKKVYKKYIRR